METEPKTEQRKKLKRYDIQGHAHELTFPVTNPYIDEIMINKDVYADL